MTACATAGGSIRWPAAVIPADAWALLGDQAPQVREGDLQAIAVPTDFLGINYYFPECVADAPGEGALQLRVVPRTGVPRTAFGWEISPQGMVDLLRRAHCDDAPGPIYLTENGSTFDDVVLPDGRIVDAERRSYLAHHLVVAREAIARGVPLEGYFAWSLLDNFSGPGLMCAASARPTWTSLTQQRRLKASGEWFAQF